MEFRDREIYLILESLSCLIEESRVLKFGAKLDTQILLITKIEAIKKLKHKIIYNGMK